MRDGYIKVCVCTPAVKVSDTETNGAEIRRMMELSDKEGSRITVFPELSITGYSCRDLFLQKKLLNSARHELLNIAKASEGKNGIFFVGLPYEHNGKIYNVAAAIFGGKILGLLPKRHIPNYNEFYEARQFEKGMKNPEETFVTPEIKTMIGTRQMFTAPEFPNLYIAAEICEDLWVAEPESGKHALSGATVIVNLSASNELAGKRQYRRELVKTQSARTYTAYLYASAGADESTTDTVFSGHGIIAEGGNILAESKLYENGMTFSEIDIDLLSGRRRMTTTFEQKTDKRYNIVPFDLNIEETHLTRYIDKMPFVPSDEKKREERCEEILTIQAMGLKKRLVHTGAKSAVIGISGGLDSTLALLVTVKAFDISGLSRENIIAVTMPGFGTTDRTYNNALLLIETLGATLRTIPIADSVTQHFKDIGHDPDNKNVTYENAQARERTQILMDIANEKNGLVIGTGDLSELALGWATYNGDHMSMYGVNGSVPKTLVRYLVRYYADTCENEGQKKVLYDVLDTPVSPELLPAKDGKISQKTEELVGPYELHDFFLYHAIRNLFTPEKVFRISKYAFKDEYDDETIKKWLITFYRRFFSQQYKRSALPDGPKVGTVSLSPRGDLRMPSDASSNIFIKEADLK
ncbi:MAG: NAD(+) synthase [Lachnospiraceae bacterium]|nr:NAD(+) synthase [Lachnospiraceae bacterium]